MIRVIIRGSAPVVGTDYCDALGIYPSIEAAEDDAYTYACDHSESFGFYQNSDGAWGEDEEGEDSFIGELDYCLEEYDPKTHDPLRAGGGSFANDFA